MALGGHRLTAIAWGVGAVVCVVLMVLIPGLEARVDTGFLVGSAATAVVMYVGVALRRKEMGLTGVGQLVEAIEHEPIEI